MHRTSDPTTPTLTPTSPPTDHQRCPADRHCILRKGKRCIPSAQSQKNFVSTSVSTFRRARQILQGAPSSRVATYPADTTAAEGTNQEISSLSISSISLLERRGKRPPSSAAQLLPLYRNEGAEEHQAEAPQTDGRLHHHSKGQHQRPAGQHNGDQQQPQ
jgi:hypothetical protein